MSEDEEAVPQKLKRIKISDLLLLFFGTDKIGFKEKGQEDTHYTFKFRENGILDLHETKEGKEKQYTSLARIDLKKLAEKFKESVLEMFSNCFVEIGVDNPEWKDIKVFPMPPDEQLAAFGEVKKRDFIISDKLARGLRPLSMQDLKNYDFKFAIFEKDGETYFIYEIHEKLFSVRQKQIEEYMKKLLADAEISLNLDHES